MKALAALATMALTVAIGTADAQATDKTAKLSDPATSGQAPAAPLGALEKASLPATVGRTGLSHTELDRIRTSIREHIHAVTARKAGVAYETLTPAIKDYYSDSKTFLNILTTQLQPIANAKSFAFTNIEREATDAIQSVLVTDPQGGEWIARFRLQRQGDGRWAIMGCQVEAAEGHRT